MTRFVASIFSERRSKRWWTSMEAQLVCMICARTTHLGVCPSSTCTTRWTLSDSGWMAMDACRPAAQCARGRRGDDNRAVICCVHRGHGVGLQRRQAQPGHEACVRFSDHDAHGNAGDMLDECLYVVAHAAYRRDHCGEGAQKDASMSRHRAAGQWPPLSGSLSSAPACGTGRWCKQCEESSRMLGKCLHVPLLTDIWVALLTVGREAWASHDYKCFKDVPMDMPHECGSSCPYVTHRH